MSDPLFPAETPASGNPAPAGKTPTFEEALARLENLVREMENGKLPLDRMISSYEEGGKLAKFCRSRLDDLERKIQILSGGDPDGAPAWDDFDPGAGR